jgi:HAD superfamily hydrolase (TIGR01509 family)
MSDPNQPILAVLFDMDGVLADSEEMWNEIDAAMLLEHGIEYRGEHKGEVLGKSFPLALDFYRSRYELRTTIEEMSLRRHAIANDFYATRIDLYPDVPRVLQHIRDSGLKVALATSSIRPLVEPFLKRHNIARFFHAVVTGEDVKNGKPNPDIYLRAASQVDTDPTRCLVIEDALSGVQAGKSAGATVAAIPDARFMDPADYVGRADYILQNLAEVLPLIEQLQRSQVQRSQA